MVVVGDEGHVDPADLLRLKRRPLCAGDPLETLCVVTEIVLRGVERGIENQAQPAHLDHGRRPADVQHGNRVPGHAVIHLAVLVFAGAPRRRARVPADPGRGLALLRPREPPWLRAVSLLPTPFSAPNRRRG